ncbi:MAG: DUF2911 domain-containing protein [Sphingobacteriales bacterium]|nr:MAG: DUF2911 domain-containing protein [Sphingobacteriales bacterium]
MLRLMVFLTISIFHMIGSAILRQTTFLFVLILCLAPFAMAQQASGYTDPVCKMKVSDGRFTYTYENKTFYFCSENCSQSFTAAPATYLSGQAAATCLQAIPDYADSVNSGFIKQDHLKGSPRRAVCQSFGTDYIKVDYGAPGVKDRVIWGGLVAYDKVWAGGAHHATKLTLMGNATLGLKQELLGGEYALFFIPGKDTWTVIINENFNQHLADDYDEKKDVLRIKVKPKKMKQAVQRLTYEISLNPKHNREGTLSLRWEQLSVEVPFKMMD